MSVRRTADRFVRVGLRLFVDGRQIGVVESAADVDAIRRRVITDISDAAYGENFGNCTVTYGFVEGSDAAKTLTEDEIYKALFIASLKNYRYAYGVYVNGSFIAANTEPSAIADAITSCRSAAQGGTDAEVELVVARRGPGDILLLSGENQTFYKVVSRVFWGRDAR